MRKDKLIFAIVILVLVTLVVPGAFAAVDNPPSQPGDNSQITPEQPQAWQEHFSYMRKFHNQYVMGMLGGCYGYGMMGGVSVTAMSKGCRTIIPVLLVEEAYDLAGQIGPTLFAGERQSIKVDSFEFGNSPFKFSWEKVKG